ncbi:hypothetical protein M3P05_10190 [Sansalvadorimonas sp. 2012CJ34-2]|uniref:Uncharacterized protein n=1 Tax=Parendozoicomonas callyspongiae TaxID=2942213 RepID=A0ABT0PFZ0_9GAMM|nr:hypothetical protein [Sansalvadorimonas sp. 2012CJ34-2]MCL6270290.1 hypothetical protein [Sansalvadorimonas sp. 2012CJ34-2]
MMVSLLGRKWLLAVWLVFMAFSIILQANSQETDPVKVPIVFQGELSSVVEKIGLSCWLLVAGEDKHFHGVIMQFNPQQRKQLHGVFDSFSANYFEYPWPSLAQFVMLGIEMSGLNIGVLEIYATPSPVVSGTKLSFQSEDGRTWETHLTGLDLSFKVGSYQLQDRSMAALMPLFLTLTAISWEQAFWYGQHELVFADTQLISILENGEGVVLSLPWRETFHQPVNTELDFFNDEYGLRWGLDRNKLLCYCFTPLQYLDPACLPLKRGNMDVYPISDSEVGFFSGNGKHLNLIDRISFEARNYEEDIEVKKEIPTPKGRKFVTQAVFSTQEVPEAVVLTAQSTVISSALSPLAADRTVTAPLDIVEDSNSSPSAASISLHCTVTMSFSPGSEHATREATPMVYVEKTTPFSKKGKTLISLESNEKDQEVGSPLRLFQSQQSMSADSTCSPPARCPGENDLSPEAELSSPFTPVKLTKSPYVETQKAITSGDKDVNGGSRSDAELALLEQPQKLVNEFLGLKKKIDMEDQYRGLYQLSKDYDPLKKTPNAWIAHQKSLLEALSFDAPDKQKIEGLGRNRRQRTGAPRKMNWRTEVECVSNINIAEGEAVSVMAVAVKMRQVSKNLKSYLTEAPGRQEWGFLFRGPYAFIQQATGDANITVTNIWEAEGKVVKDDDLSKLNWMVELKALKPIDVGDKLRMNY